MGAADNYVNLVADHAATLQDIVADHAADVAGRYGELIDRPLERDAGIWEWYYNYMLEHTITETGNASMAEQYWQEIDFYFDWSWEEFHRIPEPERGDIWTTARKMVSATALRQAQIETGLITSLLIHAHETARAVGRAASGLGRAQKREVAKATAIKATVEQRRNERANV